MIDILGHLKWVSGHESVAGRVSLISDLDRGARANRNTLGKFANYPLSETEIEFRVGNKNALTARDICLSAIRRMDKRQLRCDHALLIVYDEKSKGVRVSASKMTQAIADYLVNTAMDILYGRF